MPWRNSNSFHLIMPNEWREFFRLTWKNPSVNFLSEFFPYFPTLARCRHRISRQGDEQKENVINLHSNEIISALRALFCLSKPTACWNSYIGVRKKAPQQPQQSHVVPLFSNSSFFNKTHLIRASVVNIIKRWKKVFANVC